MADLRIRWTVISEDQFWENLRQVMACECFEVYTSVHYSQKEGTMGQIYNVEFRDSDGRQDCDVFSIYYGHPYFESDQMKVYYMVDESKLSMLAALAAIDSLMGDVVPVS